MSLFNARVHGMRAEAGKVIFDVDVDGQKSSPFTYRESPRREDLWDLNIHTTGEERDTIMDAIEDYQIANPAQKTASFAAARHQLIEVQAGALCLRCAKQVVAVEPGKVSVCVGCGARYTLAASKPS